MVLKKSRWICLLSISVIMIHCSKKATNEAPVEIPEPKDTVTIKNPVDPEVAGTIGFFLDEWLPKTLVLPGFVDTTKPASSANINIKIDAGKILTKIPTSIYGHNANIYMSSMVGETALLNHLTQLKPNIIRFPGGSLSDYYFWNAPSGVKPADAPDSVLNAEGQLIVATYWFGKRSENWTASLDNYYSMLQQTGNKGMITVNYAYARYGRGENPVKSAAHLAADWVRYDKGRTKYWEIGNENNGVWEGGYRIDPAFNKDGQPEIITGQLYGSHYKIFADSMRAAAKEMGTALVIGAQLLEKEPEGWQTNTDKTWNAGVLSQVKSLADFYIIHSYFTPYKENSSAGVILNSALTNTSTMMDYVKKSIISAGGALKPIALTEWNITSEGSRQQVSFINGLHATILLGEAIKNKYGETSRWDLSNGWNNGNDHGLFNSGDEPGAEKWNPRPAFYYMYFFQKCMGDRLLPSSVSGTDAVLSYASSFSSGQKGIVLVNKSSAVFTAGIEVNDPIGQRFYWYLLTGGNDNGEFSAKVFINGKGPDGASGGSLNYASIKAYAAPTNGGMKITLPPYSVAFLLMDKK